MDLGKLFPNSTKRKQEDKFNNLLYLCLVDWGWSYNQFLETPIPVLNRLLKKHKEITDKQEKATKKK